MPMDRRNEERVMAYFAERDDHVTAWREAGGAWRPYVGRVPLASMRAAAVHGSAKLRREALGVLDHVANDESTDVFRAALRDPVPRVRLVARTDCRVSAVASIPSTPAPS